MFKNATLYRLPPSFNLDPAELETALAEHPLRSPGPLEMETRGFVSPFGRADSALTLASSGAVMVALGTESRILPASVVKDAVTKRVATHERETGRKLGRRARNEFREEVLGELLPRALIKRSVTRAYYDQTSRLLIVDTSGVKAAEAVVTALRDALGSFPAVPLAINENANALMTDWLMYNSLRKGFEFGDSCQLTDQSDYGSVARFRNHDLTADEVREHARRGKWVTQLGLIFDGRIGFTLDDACRLLRLHFLGTIAEIADDPAAALDAEFSLMALELRRLLARLDEILGFVERWR